MVLAAGHVTFSCIIQCAILVAPCSAESIYWKMVCLLSNIYSPIGLKQGLVIDMTKQISDGKEVEVAIC